MPEGTAAQMEYMRRNKWQDLTKEFRDHDVQAFQPGDVAYFRSDASPSGRHVKIFAGFDEQGMAVWAEAKGRNSGVGVFGGWPPSGKVIAVFRPPSRPARQSRS